MIYNSQVYMGELNFIKTLNNTSKNYGLPIINILLFYSQKSSGSTLTLFNGHAWAVHSN